MYKLFLCLRYLRSRIIAYFAVLAVALCVAMMLIVISVMSGFLNKIEQAAKGLFGDVVIAGDASGIGRYDEFLDEVLQKVPAVEAGSPFILTYGMLSVPGSEYGQQVSIAGIRLPDQATVTDFAKGLRFQEGGDSPSFDPPFDLVLKNLDAESQRTEEVLQRERERLGDTEIPSETQLDLIDSLQGAVYGWHATGKRVLRAAWPYQQQLSKVREQLDAATAGARGERTDQIEQLEERLDELRYKSAIMSPSNRIILGLGIPGLSNRTDEGETIRSMVPGHRIELGIWLTGRRVSKLDVPWTRSIFTVIDDSRTDVSSIDNTFVYVPFETLQRINNMGPQYFAEGGGQTPGRCSQIHVKVKPEFAKGEKLEQVASDINELWLGFQKRYPDAGGDAVKAMTWRRRQAAVIEPIQQQRLLVITMFGIISLVSVVLIFVIFYTIVVQKTRDIGVMKTLGASSFGVAQIFLAYGAMIGLVGAIIGCIGGYYFVRYINPIQDSLDQLFGFRVWSREVFLFEKIPNEVNALPAAIIMIGAILAGLVGAIIPAVRAAKMQPVEALRYE